MGKQVFGKLSCDHLRKGYGDIIGVDDNLSYFCRGFAQVWDSYKDYINSSYSGDIIILFEGKKENNNLYAVNMRRPSEYELSEYEKSLSKKEIISRLNSMSPLIQKHVQKYGDICPHADECKVQGTSKCYYNCNAINLINKIIPDASCCHFNLSCDYNSINYRYTNCNRYMLLLVLNHVIDKDYHLDELVDKLSEFCQEKNYIDMRIKELYLDSEKLPTEYEKYFMSGDCKKCSMYKLVSHENGDYYGSWTTDILECTLKDKNDLKYINKPIHCATYYRVRDGYSRDYLNDRNIKSKLFDSNISYQEFENRFKNKFNLNKKEIIQGCFISVFNDEFNFIRTNLDEISRRFPGIL